MESFIFCAVHIVLSSMLYFVFSRIKDKFPPKAQIFFVVQKFTTNFVRDNRVWPTFDQVSYRNFYLSSDIFWCSNVYLKTLSGTLWFDPYFPCKRSFSRFQPKAHIFLEFKNLFKKLYQGQHGLTYIVLSRIL